MVEKTAIRERIDRAKLEALELEIYLQELGIVVSKVRLDASNIFVIFENGDWCLCLYGLNRSGLYEYSLKYSKKGQLGTWIEIGFNNEDLERHVVNYEGLNGPATKMYISAHNAVGPTNYDAEEHLISKERATKFIKSWLKSFE